MTIDRTDTVFSRSVTSRTPSFLRDMLKSPRFSTTLGQQLPAGSMSSRNASFATSSGHTTDKENFHHILASNKASHTGSPMGKYLPSPNNSTFSTQDARISKAQSSIASSSHYAQGYLPQYPRNVQYPSGYYVRSHTPQLYNHAQSGYHAFSRPGYDPSSSHRYPPQYDGPAESSPRSQARSNHMVNGVGEMVNGVNEGDRRISTQEFETDRGNVPSAHGPAVDDFFGNVREAERKEMNSPEEKASNGL